MKKLLILGLAATAICRWQAAAQTVDSVITNALFEPHSVTVDDRNNIYITDAANNRIALYSAESGILTSLSGNNAPGAPGYAESPYGARARWFDPKGIVYDPWRAMHTNSAISAYPIIVADSGNHRIRLMNLGGGTTSLAGSGLAGASDGIGSAAQFSYPAGLAVDTNGNVYVADSKIDAIRKIKPDGTVSTLALSSKLYEPGAVAVGDNGELWVADTRNHAIKRFDARGQLIGLFGSGHPTDSGFRDSLFGGDARFTKPRALLWLGGNAGLVVSDTGNQLLRRVYANSIVSDFSVETFAGVPGQAGHVNGNLLAATFNSPIGLCFEPANNGFLVVDSAGSSVRRIQFAPPRAPVINPVIGWVDFVKDAFGDYVSLLVPVTQGSFNNDIIIAILDESGSETFFTKDASPVNPLEDTIPFPTKTTGTTPPPYDNGWFRHQVQPSIIPSVYTNDITIKAVSSQDGRRPSQLVRARFQFKTANPVILGDNAASFEVSTATDQAVMYYDYQPGTNDFSDPSPTSPGVKIINASRQVLSIPITSGDYVRVKILAKRAGFKDSGVITKLFSIRDQNVNRISLGFENGEASSRFKGAPGQRFYAPITMSVLPGTVMYSLQFNLHATNLLGSAPIVLTNSNPLTFESSLIFKGSKLNFVLPPDFIPSTPTNFIGAYNSNYRGFNPLILNTNNSRLLVGWAVLRGLKIPFTAEETWDTISQHLVQYSQPHDTVFDSLNGKIVVGGFSFVIPSTASTNHKYKVEIDRVSATSDGVGALGSGVFVKMETGGDGRTNLLAIRNLEIDEEVGYIVGDSAPFKWFNAGDFGDGILQSDDVAQIYRASMFLLNTPPGGTLNPPSDFWDVMDSASGRVGLIATNISQVNQAINSMLFGDGILDVGDLFVTYRRSLDPDLQPVKRVWRGGALVPLTGITNVIHTGRASVPAQRLSTETEEIAASGAESPEIQFVADEVRAAPGGTVDVPIRARIKGNYPLRVLMLNLDVFALDHSPLINAQVEFVPSPAIGKPSLTYAQNVRNYNAAWLDPAVDGLSGDSVVGLLRIRLPETADANSSYRIQIQHASGSSIGVGTFPKRIEQGLVVLGDRSRSSWNDGIPDLWRLRHFGSLENVLSQANADADGDGVPNAIEYRAGTVPTDLASVLKLRSERRKGLLSRGITLRWPSVLGKKYRVESADALVGRDWSVIADGVEGTGRDHEFTDASLDGAVKFYRVQVAE